MYLVEENNTEQDEEGELVNPLPGRRICVLSLQGDMLEVCQNPIEGNSFTFTDTLCCFDGKLLAPVQGLSGVFVEAVALRDL